jgi:thiol-disulfide isomerase/thioredoxin
MKVRCSVRGFLIAALAVCVAGLAGLAMHRVGTEFLNYSIHQPPAAQPPTAGDAGPAGSNALSFSFPDHPLDLPALRFADADDRDLSLADFRGRPVVLNIWATWCTPCRQEMSSLDRLQAALGKSQLLVLPLSIDSQGVSVVKAFYRELGLKQLDIYYLDRSAEASRALSTVGIPTTLLIDRDGREVGRKIGAAEWDGPEVIELIQRHLGVPAAGSSAKEGQ